MIVFYKQQAAKALIKIEECIANRIVSLLGGQKRTVMERTSVEGAGVASEKPIHQMLDVRLYNWTRKVVRIRWRQEGRVISTV